MGSGTSVVEKELPELITKEHFLKLAESKYTKSSYDYFVDHDDLISRKRIIEIASMTDVYLSHEWGIDERGRCNHDRVLKINGFLRSKGIFTFIEEGQQSCSGIVKTVDRIRDSITKTQCILVFMTKRYFEKISRPYDHLVKTEFLLGMELKGSPLILPVIMEEEANMETVPKTQNMVYDEFKYKRCIDMTEFEYVPDQLDTLYRCLLTVIKPLREGGPFERTRFIWHTSCEGRHYEWLRTHTNFHHLLALDYAGRFAANGVQTTSQIFQKLQLNGEFLTNLDIPPEHETIIKKALKGDLSYNMASIPAQRIDAIVAISNQKLKDETEEENAKTLHFDTIASRIKDSINMGLEDEYSLALRAHWKTELFQSLLEERKQKMLSDAENQRADFASTMRLVHRLAAEQQLRSIEDTRLTEFLRIAEITSVDQIIRALWALLVNGDTYMKRAASQQAEYFAPKNNKHEQINTFNASEMSSGGYDRRLGAMYLQVNEHRDEDRDLEYMLRESCYIFHVLQLLCENNTNNANQVTLFGGIRMIVSLLAQSFLFHCEFKSPFMLADSFQQLFCPIEGLKAVKFLCNGSKFRSYSNTRLIFLFAEAGAIGLMMDIIRFHMDVDSIVKWALVNLALLLSSSNGELTDDNMLGFMNDSSNLVVLTLLLEKHSKIRTAFASELTSAVLVIFGLLLRNGKFNAALEKNRLHLIASTTMGAIAEGSLCDDDTKLRLCHTLENIFYRHWCQWDELATTNSFNRNFPTSQGWKIPTPLNLVVICQLERLKVIRFLHQELFGHTPVELGLGFETNANRPTHMDRSRRGPTSATAAATAHGTPTRRGAGNNDDGDPDNDNDNRNGRRVGLHLGNAPSQGSRGFYLAALRCVCNMCGISKTYKESCAGNGIQERIVSILKAAALDLLPTAAVAAAAAMGSVSADTVAATLENTELVNVCLLAIGNLMVLHSGGMALGATVDGGDSTLDLRREGEASPVGGSCVDGGGGGGQGGIGEAEGSLAGSVYQQSSRRRRPLRYQMKTHNFNVQSSASKFAFVSAGSSVSANESVQSAVHFADSVAQDRESPYSSNYKGRHGATLLHHHHHPSSTSEFPHQLDAGFSMESVPHSANAQSSVVTFSSPDNTRMPPPCGTVFVDPFTVYLLHKGVSEILLQILRNNYTERSLTYSAMFLVSKLVYKGCTNTCDRLGALGICEQVYKVMKHYLADKDLFLVSCIVVSGICSSETVLTGASIKLLKLGISELVVDGMKLHCHVTGKSKWTHMSSPYCCRVCTEGCFAAYCLTKRDANNSRYSASITVASATSQFVAAGFLALLVRPAVTVSKDKGLVNLLEESRSLLDFRFSFQENPLPRPLMHTTVNVIVGTTVIPTSTVVTDRNGKPYTDLQQQQRGLPTETIHHNSNHCIERFLPPNVGSEKQLLSQYITPTGTNAPQQVVVMENIKHLQENNFVNVDRVGNLSSAESDTVMKALFATFNIVTRG